MQTDDEEPSRPGKGFLIALGAVCIVLGLLVAAELVVPLQPKLSVGGVTPIAGVASISMPPTAGQVGFSPANITIFLSANATVKWTNQDNTAHTVVVCPAGAPQGCSPSAAVAYSGIMQGGKTFQVTFNSTGSYFYYCSLHPLVMRGLIHVLGGATVNIAGGTSTQQLNYAPATMTVVVGVNSSVTFINADSATHSVTFTSVPQGVTASSISDQSLGAGQSFAVSLTVPGTYMYHCIYHSWMQGTIVVVS